VKSIQFTAVTVSDGIYFVCWLRKRLLPYLFIYLLTYFLTYLLTGKISLVKQKHERAEESLSLVYTESFPDNS